MKKIRWNPGSDSDEGRVLEVRLPSGKIAYLQYLTEGNIGTLVRVLGATYERPLDGKDLIAQVRLPEAFMTQCRWNELENAASSTLRGVIPVPTRVWDGLAIHVAPTIRNLDESLFLTADGHVWRGSDVKVRFPNVERHRCPLSSCPSSELLLERIDLGWTPAVAHDRLWTRRTAEARATTPSQ